MVQLQLLNLLLLKTMPKAEKDGVFIKPGCAALNVFPNMMHARFMLGEHPRKPINLNAWFQLLNMYVDVDLR